MAFINGKEVLFSPIIGVNGESSGGDSGGGAGGGLDINGVIREYEVNAGASVSAGDFVEFVAREFNSGASTWISACKLDNSRVLVAYCDGGNSSYGTAVILRFADGFTSVGTKTVFNSAVTAFISAVALTDSKVLVAYCSGATSAGSGTAVVLSISGTDITLNSSKVFCASNSDYFSAVALTDSKVLVAYRNSTNGIAIVLTISGTTISAGTAKTFGSGTPNNISAVALTDSKVLVAYCDNGNNAYGTAIVLTISGTTISAGTKKVFLSNTATGNFAVALTDSKVLVACQDRGNSWRGTAIVLTISGTTISAGTAVAFTDSYAYNISAVALTDSKALVAYRYNNFGRMVVFDINGTTISAGEMTTFEYESVTYESLVVFSETSVLAVYNAAVVGKFADLAINGTTIVFDGLVKKATSNSIRVGVAKTSGAEGEMVEVYCAV